MSDFILGRAAEDLSSCLTSFSTSYGVELASSLEALLEGWAGVPLKPMQASPTLIVAETPDGFIEVRGSGLQVDPKTGELAAGTIGAIRLVAGGSPEASGVTGGTTVTEATFSAGQHRIVTETPGTAGHRQITITGRNLPTGPAALQAFFEGTNPPQMSITGMRLDHGSGPGARTVFEMTATSLTMRTQDYQLRATGALAVSLKPEQLLSLINEGDATALAGRIESLEAHQLSGGRPKDDGLVFSLNGAGAAEFPIGTLLAGGGLALTQIVGSSGALLDASGIRSGIAADLNHGLSFGGVEVGVGHQAFAAMAGGDGDDTLTGDGGDNRLDGGGGNDVLVGDTGAGFDFRTLNLPGATANTSPSVAAIALSAKGASIDKALLLKADYQNASVELLLRNAAGILTRITAQQKTEISASMSADGRFVAYGTWNWETGERRAFAYTGGVPVELSGAQAAHASDNGVFYIRQLQGAGGTPGGTELRRWVSGTDHKSLGTAYTGLAAVSADGRRLVAWNADGRQVLVTVDGTGAISAPPTLLETGGITITAISNDGTVALGETWDDYGSSVLRIAPAGTVKAVHSFWGWGAALSGDGSFVVYDEYDHTAGTYDDGANLSLYEVATGQRTLLTEARSGAATGRAWAPAISADGRHIVFTASAGSLTGTADGERLLALDLGPGRSIGAARFGGADTLIGGLGADTLTGAAGADHFVYEAADLSAARAIAGDTITDFASGEDRIVLRGLYFAFDAASPIRAKGSAPAGTGYLYVETLSDGDEDRHRLVYVDADGAETLLATIHGDAPTGRDILGAVRGAGTLAGTIGDDEIVGSDSKDTLNGDAGNDTLHGLGGDDVLNGGTGDDVLSGGAGKDTLNGGAGNDVYVLAEGDFDGTGALVDAIVDGGGIDTVRTARSLSLAGLGVIENLVFTGSGAFAGTGNAAANRITGGDGDDVLDGGGGNDTLSGGKGADTLTGGLGADSLLGGDGDDLFVYTGGADATGDVADGGGGSNRIRLDFGGAISFAAATLRHIDALEFGAKGNGVTLSGEQLDGIARLTGGAGTDTIQLGGDADAAVTLTGKAIAGIERLSLRAGDRLTADQAALDGIKAISGVRGGRGNVLTLTEPTSSLAGVGLTASGSSGAKWEVRFSGDLTVGQSSLAAIGALNGGGGEDDRLILAGPVTTLSGAVLSGIERLALGGGQTLAVTVAELAGITRIEGGGAEAVTVAMIASGTLIPTLTHTGLKRFTIQGTAGHDAIAGTAGDDALNGGAGNDTLSGGAGDDMLAGGLGADSLDGGAGDDVIVYAAVGETAGDTIVGGAGSDTIHLAAPGAFDLSKVAIDGVERLMLDGGSTVTLTRAQLDGFTTLVGAAGKVNVLRIAAASGAVTDGPTVLDLTKLSGIEDVQLLRAGDSLTLDGSQLGDKGVKALSTTRGDKATVLTLTGTASDLTGTSLTASGSRGEKWAIGFGGTLTVSQANLNAVGALTGGVGEGDTLTLGGADKAVSLAGIALSGIETIDAGSKALTATGESLAGVKTLTGTDAAVVNATAGRPLDLTGLSHTGFASFTVNGTAGTDTIAGSDGADVILGGACNDSLAGGTGNDTLSGGAGGDTLSGGAGNDTFVYTAGSEVGSDALGYDEIDGGDGIDTIGLGTAGAFDLTYATIGNVETLQFNARGNTVSLTSDQLNGFASVSGGAGTDVIRIAEGRSTGIDLSAKASGIEQIQLRAVDSLTLAATQLAAHQPADGPKGSIAALSTVRNDGGSGSVLTLTGDGADLTKTALTATGSSGAKWEVRFDGALSVSQANLNGIGRLTGGGGADTLRFGGAGSAVSLAGIALSGIEAIDLGTRTLAVTAATLDGVATIAGAGRLQVGMTQAGEIDLGAKTLGADVAVTIAGSAGHDGIVGSANADVITGGAGNDSIAGGAGNDRIDGGAGKDVIAGGAGSDTLTGGLGADWFVYGAVEEGGDSIADFRSGEGDKLVFGGAAFGNLAGSAEGTELGSANFATVSGLGVGGQGISEGTDAAHHFVFNTTNRTLYFDADGAGGAAGIAVASFAPGTALKATDILIVAG